MRRLRKPLTSALEVRGTKVARAASGASRRVREPDPEREELELLARIEEARREAGGVQEAPEVVARIREVRTGGRARAPGIDAAEEDPQSGPQDVRDG